MLNHGVMNVALVELIMALSVVGTLLATLFLCGRLYAIFLIICCEEFFLKLFMIGCQYLFWGPYLPHENSFDCIYKKRKSVLPTVRAFRPTGRGVMIDNPSVIIAMAKTLITHCFVNGELRAPRFATEVFRRGSAFASRICYAVSVHRPSAWPTVPADNCVA